VERKTDFSCIEWWIGTNESTLQSRTDSYKPKNGALTLLQFVLFGDQNDFLARSCEAHRGNVSGCQTWRPQSFELLFLFVRRTIPKSTWPEIKTAFATGSVSLRELARQMNIPEGTILARAKREGWTREIQNAKALVKREETRSPSLPLKP
jgi:hypothetical protein